MPHAELRQPADRIVQPVNACLKRGGRAIAACTSEAYVDVGTVRGYREAVTLLSTLTL